VAALVALAGCTKYPVECELVVQPRVMVSEGSDPLTPAYMARVYVWYINKKEHLDHKWRPESYTDAEAGVVRHRDTGEVWSFGLSGTQSGEKGYVHIPLTSSPVLLVAIDPVNKLYAWRTFEFRVPLESVLVPVTFRTYYRPEQFPYRDGDWTVLRSESENTPQEENSEDGEK
jgi:hypothetical protein